MGAINKENQPSLQVLHTYLHTKIFYQARLGLTVHQIAGLQLVSVTKVVYTLHHLQRTKVTIWTKHLEWYIRTNFALDRSASVTLPLATSLNSFITAFNNCMSGITVRLTQTMTLPTYLPFPWYCHLKLCTPQRDHCRSSSCLTLLPNE